MEIEIRVPEVGESVQEAVLAEWFVADGATVAKDQALFLLETDKVTLEVPAGAAGTVKLGVKAGSTVKVGQVVGKIVAGAGAAVGKGAAVAPPAAATEAPMAKAAPKEEAPAKAPPAKEQPPPVQAEPPRAVQPAAKAVAAEARAGQGALAPSIRKLVEEKGLDPAKIPATGPGGWLTRGDVLLYLEQGPEQEQGQGKADAAPATEPSGPRAPKPEAVKAEPASEGDEPVTRKPLSPIRKRIAERLLEAKRSTAMLTTFNEVDMGAVMELRERHKAAFRAKHGVGLGITSFFVQAACRALAAFPQVNAFIEGDEIVYHGYVNMGIAIGAARGLVVPVVRRAERLGAPAIEKAIADFADKVQENRLELSDLEGGTFTITNGGVFGSLLSTPILNPPQSAILGLHKVEPRPVAADGQVVIRPMMYVALSYDHRIIDGREAVQFLVRIKDLVQEPERLWLEV